MKAGFLAAALGLMLAVSFVPPAHSSLVSAAPKSGSKVHSAPEPITYERAIEIENARHIKNLRAIKRFYRMHRPMRIRETRKEYEYHAKRLEEIQKQYGAL